MQVYRPTTAGESPPVPGGLAVSPGRQQQTLGHPTRMKAPLVLRAQRDDAPRPERAAESTETAASSDPGHSRQASESVSAQLPARETHQDEPTSLFHTNANSGRLRTGPEAGESSAGPLRAVSQRDSQRASSPDPVGQS